MVAVLESSHFDVWGSGVMIHDIDVCVIGMACGKIAWYVCSSVTAVSEMINNNSIIKLVVHIVEAAGTCVCDQY